MFLLNSRQSHFTATSQRFGYPNARRHPFSRSYGVMLPNSLTRVLPFALVSSTHLPVSDCGTGTQSSTLRGFSWQHGSTTYALRLAIAPQLSQRIFLPALNAYTLSTTTTNRWLAYLVRPPFTPSEWYRNIDRLSIAYASRPRLRPD